MKNLVSMIILASLFCAGTALANSNMAKTEKKIQKFAGIHQLNEKQVGHVRGMFEQQRITAETLAMTQNQNLRAVQEVETAQLINDLKAEQRAQLKRFINIETSPSI